MKTELITYAIKNLTARKTRSLLSVLSIMVGIAAIFALVSFGLGIQDYVNSLAKESGSNKLFVQAKGIGAPGSDTTFSLTQQDITFISRIQGVKDAVGIYLAPVKVLFNDQVKFFYALGIDAKKQSLIDETFTLKLLSGRELNTGDTSKVVLGYNYGVADKIFSRPVKLGDKIDINKNRFEAVGFYQELGNPSDDANIYMTDTAFEMLYPDQKGKFSEAILSAQPGTDPKDLANTITDKLRKYRGEKKGQEDFFVQTFSDALSTFTNIIGIINGVLVLIAFISLVVASVNIMNTMYTAILDRTQEIGIMKAIGARRSDILLIFVAESGFLGLIGGVLGVITGFIIASTGGKIAADAGYALLKPIFPLVLIAGSIIFAFLIGAVSGILPARQASRLNPAEALREE